MAVQETRSGMLVDQFTAACDELRTTISSVPDDKWQVPTPDDGRQVNVVAHHAAAAHRYIVDMAQAMVSGQPSSLSMAQIHAGNAEHARNMGSVTKQEALQQHDSGVEYARAWLNGLSDEQLAVRGELLIGLPVMTAEQAIEMVLIGHPREHAATIQAALR